jgi:hypothetical protein
MKFVHESITLPVSFNSFSYCSMYELEFLSMRDFINSLFSLQFMVFNSAYSVFDYMTKNYLDLKLKRKVIVSKCEDSRQNTVDYFRFNNL